MGRKGKSSKNSQGTKYKLEGSVRGRALQFNPRGGISRAAGTGQDRAGELVCGKKKKVKREYLP